MGSHQIPVTVEMSVERLAETLVDKCEDYTALLKLIEEIDDTVAEWDFTLRAAREILDQVRQYAVEEQRPEIHETVLKLVGLLNEQIDDPEPVQEDVPDPAADLTF